MAEPIPNDYTSALSISDSECLHTQTVVERGGNPDKIRESQRKRHAPVEAVDEVIAMFEDHRKSESTSPSLSSYRPWQLNV